MNSRIESLHLAASLEDIRKCVAEGLHCHLEVSTPEKREYLLRIGVRDEHNDRFGAVDVATSGLQSATGMTRGGIQTRWGSETRL